MNPDGGRLTFHDFGDLIGLEIIDVSEDDRLRLLLRQFPGRLPKFVVGVEVSGVFRSGRGAVSEAK